MASRELSILVKAKGAIQAAKDIGKVSSATGRLVLGAEPGFDESTTVFAPIVRAISSRVGESPVTTISAAPMARATDALVSDAERLLLRLGAVRPGDRIVLVAGTTPLPGATNMVKILRVGR